MSGSVGDRITLHANAVDSPDRVGTIVGVLGSDGPPYRVRFDNGDESILTPGPDATIEAPSAGERLEQVADQAKEAARETAEKAQETAGKARETAEDATGRAARAVADTAAKIAERFRR